MLAWGEKGVQARATPVEKALWWEGAGTSEKLAEAECGCNRGQRGTRTRGFREVWALTV